jgi:arylsulfatase
MQTDRTEQQNLASQYPEEVERLSARWTGWAKASNVLPKPKQNRPANRQNARRSRAASGE